MKTTLHHWFFYLQLPANANNIL